MRKRPRIRKCEAVSAGGQAPAALPYDATVGALMTRPNRASSIRGTAERDWDSKAPGLNSASTLGRAIPASAAYGSLGPPERPGAAPSGTRRHASAKATWARKAAWRKPDE